MASRMNEVRWLELPSVRDERGVLTAIEAGRDVPFPILRVFLVHHTTTDRGGHAHKDTDQVVTAAAGELTLEVTDGHSSQSFKLDDPTRGVYVPRMLFVRLQSFSADAVCLVFASTHYNMKQSYRSWEAYLEAIAGGSYDGA